MFIDLYSSIRITLYLAGMGVLALGMYRAVQMGRGFVDRLYRGRAYWTAVVMLLFIIELVVGSVLGNGMGVVSLIFFSLFVFALFVFAERTVQVAITMDFFHRNTLRWRQVRMLLYVVILVDVVYGIVGTAFAGVSPLIYFDTILAAFVVVIVALAVSAGRTPERTIKRHVRLFGISLLGFIVALFTSQPGVPFVVNLVSWLLVVGVAYSLFLMAMSLSPIGKVGNGVEAASQPV